MSESSKEMCHAPALSHVICKPIQQRRLDHLYKNETSGLKTVGGGEGGIPAACLKRIVSLCCCSFCFSCWPLLLRWAVAVFSWPDSREMQWGWMTASHLKYTFHQPNDLWTHVLNVSYDPWVCITIYNILRKPTGHKAFLTSVSVACLPV